MAELQKIANDVALRGACACQQKFIRSTSSHLLNFNSNEISNTFNEHFATIGPKLACEIPSTSDEVSTYLNNFPVNFNKFSFRPTTSSSVFTLLNRLSKTKSTGLGNISAKLIRD